MEAVRLIDVMDEAEAAAEILDLEVRSIVRGRAAGATRR